MTQSFGTAVLRDVASIDRQTVKPEQIRPGDRYVGLENIGSDGRFQEIGEVEPGELKSNKFRFDPEHVLYGKLRPYLSKIARPDFSGICSTDILPIRPGKTLHGPYLFHFLRTPTMVGHAASLSTGINLPRLSPKALGNFEIPLPPIEEQRRIAAILDAADALRAKRRQALAKLDTLTQAIFIDMFGDLQLNPFGWPTQRVDEVCDLVVDCVNKTAPTVSGPTDYKMIRTTNVKRGSVDLIKVRFVERETFERWNRRVTPTHGDVLLTREAPVGEVGILRGVDKVFLGQRLMLYRPLQDVMTSEFLMRTFQSPFLQRQFDRHGSGSTVKHLKLGPCSEFQVRVPPIERLRDFGEIAARTARMAGAEVSSVDGLDTLFACLQQRAFRGEL